MGVNPVGIGLSAAIATFKNAKAAKASSFVFIANVYTPKTLLGLVALGANVTGLALSLLVVWFGVHWSFVAIMHAKSARDRLSRYWKVMLWPLVVIGLALDVAFNVVFGSLMFLELPRELLFTSRCQRHAHKGSRLALWWAKQLNAFDPGHIK
jgi:hypothetical protein